MLRKTVSYALACLLFTAVSVHAGTLSVVGQSRWVHVGKVIDGDTFRTLAGEKIRLLGINAPEIAHDNKPGQPYGREAKRRLQQMIAGKTVRLQLDRERRDRYGRTLAQIFLRDGGWVNEQLVRDGLAFVYTFAPNFYWAKALLRAEKQARSNMRGIWRSETFRVLDSQHVNYQHIGQFRLLRGTIKVINRSRFQLGNVTITIPRTARQWFAASQLPQHNRAVLVRGRLRTSSGGGLFLPLHSPYDLE